MHAVAYADTKCINIQLLPATIFSLFRQRQVPIHLLLTGTRIFEKDFTLVDSHISILQLSTLIRNAIKLWPSNDLAFILGQQWLTTQSGILTQGLLCSRDFSQAQFFWQRHYWSLQPWLQTSRWHTQNQQHILFQQDLSLPELQQFFTELTLSSLVSCFKQLTHCRFQGHFSLPYSSPSNIDQYYKYLGDKLTFNQPIGVVSFDLSLNQTAFSLRNSQSFLQAKRLARYQYFQKPFNIGLPAAVRLQLKKSYQTSTTLPEIAAQLSLSPATLKRRLKDFNTTFQQLQDEVKLQQAIYLLVINGCSNTLIAKQLKFADSNNFRRSFKRWTGQLPSYFKDWLST